MEKYLEWFKAGAVLGGVVSLAMPYINQFLGSSVYGVTLSIFNIRTEVMSKVTQGNEFAKFLLNYLPGGIPSVPGLPVWLVALLISAAGMGVMVVLGKIVFDLLNGMLSIPKKAELMTVFGLGSLGAGALVAWQLPQFAIEPLVFLAITGFILGWILQQVYGLLGWGMPN